MKKTFFLLLILSTSLFSSCSIKLKGSFRGLYSYYKKTVKENPDLLVRADRLVNICEIKFDEKKPKIYMINGKMLKKCIAEHDKAIVYMWATNCKGRFCYSPQILQRECNAKNVELFIVAEYYDNEPMQMNYFTEHPVFGIDTKYYRSNLTSKYRSRFLYDITIQKDILNRILYFENGNFVKEYQSIDFLDNL